MVARDLPVCHATVGPKLPRALAHVIVQDLPVLIRTDEVAAFGTPEGLPAGDHLLSNLEEPDRFEILSSEGDLDPWLTQVDALHD